MQLCRDLWEVYLTCMAWLVRCPDRFAKWALDDADHALDNYLAAVERELERRVPGLV